MALSTSSQSKYLRVPSTLTSLAMTLWALPPWMVLRPRVTVLVGSSLLTHAEARDWMIAAWAKIGLIALSGLDE